MVEIKDNTEKICSFYVSDYHLEMIMIPYISKKIEEKTNIIICSEKDLSKSVKKVIENINLPEESKKEILKLNWKENKNFNLKIRNDKENIIFINGNEEYRKQIYNEINKQRNIKIIDCYDADINENQLEVIKEKHSKVLNTLGIEEF